ncbi:MAG: hypothetical protein JWM46_781 [Candidatus Kaiserbacteria bacterium]|nr:hypothetical protein [Candidatus Kaiserbacteria bacterium]
MAAYWKRFVESVTDLVNKYRYDPFFRTEVHVIALQAAFALVLLALMGTAYNILSNDVANAILHGLAAGGQGKVPYSLGTSIVAQTQALRTHNFISLVCLIVGQTALFGYIIARITLTPTRDALAAQKQFIGNIAHELRTPLSVIKTNTEVSLLGEVSAELKTTLKSNIEELDRINEIINNLLSLSALVKPERIEFTAVDLSVIATDAVQKYSQLAKSGDHQVTLRKSPDAQVWGNATALTQIVGNLIKNALSYTPRGGHVRITVEPAPDNQVEILVQDSGIGIARKDLFRIFEPFYRADPSRTKGAGGTGLGLAIVSELIKMHQGKITIRSAIGRGTTVAVLFPGIRGRVTVGNEADLRDGLNEIAVDFSKR